MGFVNGEKEKKMKLLDGNELWVEIYRLARKRKWKNRTNIAFRKCLDVIQFFPKIDAEPVKHGHWIPTEQTPDFEWECSVCGNGFTNNKLSYCYDCGARMDEEMIE